MYGEYCVLWDIFFQGIFSLMFSGGNQKGTLGKDRSSRPEVFCEKSAFENLAIFTGLQAYNFFKKRLQSRYFLGILRNF